jgi:hypothetical protein
MGIENFLGIQPQEEEVQVRGEQQLEREGSSKEKKRGFDIDFYVTDHSADHEDTGSPEKLRELYGDIKKDGIESIRFDCHWDKLEPNEGEFNAALMARYIRATEIMREVGLKESTIILSNPPKWAKELYESDKEKFFQAYQEYVGRVKDGLASSGGETVTTIQVLNELNNSVYTPVAVEDLPRMCDITREVFQDYNPNLKLMASLLAANFPDRIKWATLGNVSFGTHITQYLRDFKKVKDSFDVIAVDYYPGIWHLAPGNFDSMKLGDMYKALSKNQPVSKKMKDRYKAAEKDLYKAMIKNMDLLKSSFEEIAKWGKEYELGEVGMRTNPSALGTGVDEKGQRYFYDVFFREFKKMMLQLEEQGLPLPSRVGLYEAIDEPATTILQKIAGRLPAPFTSPENAMGMRTADGQRKMILRGAPKAKPEQRSQQPSQLKKIISYMRAPVDKE